MKRYLVRTFGVLLPIALASTVFAGTAAVQAKACGSSKSAIVTPKATASKPLMVSVDTAAGLGTTSTGGSSGDTGKTSHAYPTVVVKGPKSAKLFVRVEFLPFEDYDLFFRTTDGSAIAYAAGFNPAGPEVNAQVAPGQGGHSEVGAEQIDGAGVKGCATYVVDIASATTPGGAVTVKYWLGK